MPQVTYQPEERARLQRQLTEQAIKLALDSHWEEAAAINRQILSAFPRDLSTLNRLGKALSELGQYADAKAAYSEALTVDPSNSIARKNLDRLAQLGDSAPQDASRASHERIDPRLFIEETGKTGFTNLVELAPLSVLARLAAGDQVYLQREGNLLYVANGGGERIGRIEPRLANRLIKFMDGGNEYAAGITELHEQAVRLIVRETFQHPSQFGRVSFPTQGGGETVRPYTRLQHNTEEDEYGEDGEYLDNDDDDDEEDSDMHETDLEEESTLEPEE